MPIHDCWCGHRPEQHLPPTDYTPDPYNDLPVLEKGYSSPIPSLRTPDERGTVGKIGECLWCKRMVRNGNPICDPVHEITLDIPDHIHEEATSLLRELLFDEGWSSVKRRLTYSP